jgi:streptomycin 6-kinase
MNFPKIFVDNITNASGTRGAMWLKELPDLISDCQKTWSLNKLTLVENLSFNCVLRANRQDDSSPVILKLAISSPELKQEIRALQIYNGHGAVKLLEVDLDKGACLLEALLPGGTLKPFFPENDENATQIMLDVMKKLHQHKLPSDLSGFPTIENWLSALNNKNELPFSSWITRAKRIATRLLKTQGHMVLLHGDLHHENILQNNNEWISIDPKGVLGETAYEVGSFVRNPMPELLQYPDPLKLIKKRLELCSSNLNIEMTRLIHWCFVQAVLSACWAYEDNTDWRPWVKCAELIHKAESIT